MTYRNNPTQYDAIVIGAGPNGLAAAITLARAGRSVLVVEANDTIGGGARSAALTLPGFMHDVCSAIHPLGRAGQPRPESHGRFARRGRRPLRDPARPRGTRLGAHRSRTARPVSHPRPAAPPVRPRSLRPPRDPTLQ